VTGAVFYTYSAIHGYAGSRSGDKKGGQSRDRPPALRKLNRGYCSGQ
jgi:hypothetical protein